MENTLGIEPHGIDRWRIKLAAETLRHLSKGNEGISQYAQGLDELADNMSRPGSQYVWANMDKKGQSVSIPQSEWDAIIPALVKAQFDTPLKALNGHTLADLAPDMSKRFNKIDNLSDAMAEAAIKGKDTVPGFSKGQYRIEEVFSAGLSGWMKSIDLNRKEGTGVSSVELMDRINSLSENLRAAYRGDTPEASVPGPHVTPRIRDLAVKPLSIVADATSQAASWQPRLRETIANKEGLLSSYAGGSLLGGPLSASMKDLMSTKLLQDNLLNQGDSKNKK
jgi:hypothetical protein